MMYIYDGREHFYQWDVRQKITSPDFKVGEEIHFVNVSQSFAMVVLTYENNGKVVADVPNILLEKTYPIIAYRYVYADDSSYTTDRHQFNVLRRQKPDPYVYEETELYTVKAVVDKAVREAIDSGELDGKSAYEVAVENGFEGTEQEWLDSLKGKDGKDGVSYVTDTITVNGITWTRTKWADGRYEAYCTVTPSADKNSFTVTFPDTLSKPFVRYSIIEGGLSFDTSCETTTNSFKMSYDVGTIREVNIYIIGEQWRDTTWKFRKDITVDEVLSFLGLDAIPTNRINEQQFLDCKFFARNGEGATEIQCAGFGIHAEESTEVYICGYVTKENTHYNLCRRLLPGHTTLYGYKFEMTLNEEPSLEVLEFLQVFCERIS